MKNTTCRLANVVEYSDKNTGMKWFSPICLTLFLVFLLSFSGLPATADTLKARSVSIPPNTEVEVVHGRSAVIASHGRSGSRIELSISVVTGDDDPLHTRVALVDGQRFTLAITAEDPDKAITRYMFRRAGGSVELTLLSGDAPIEATLEMSSLLHPTDGTAGQARQSAVTRATLRR